MTKVVLLNALDLAAIRLRGRDPVRRPAAVCVLLEAWVGRTLSALEAFHVACPRPIVRGLRSLRSQILTVPMCIYFIVLVIELSMIRALLHVRWKAAERLLLLLRPICGISGLLVRWRALQLAAAGLERVLLLFQHDLRGEVHLVLARSIALGLGREPAAAVLVPSVDPHGALITVLVAVLLDLQKNRSIFENQKGINRNNLPQSSSFSAEQTAGSRSV